MLRRVDKADQIHFVHWSEVKNRNRIYKGRAVGKKKSGILAEPPHTSEVRQMTKMLPGSQLSYHVLDRDHRQLMSQLEKEREREPLNAEVGAGSVTYLSMETAPLPHPLQVLRVGILQSFPPQRLFLQREERGEGSATCHLLKGHSWMGGQNTSSLHPPHPNREGPQGLP